MSSGAKKEKSFNGTKAKFSPNAAVPEKKAEVKLRRKESEKVKQPSDSNRKSVLGRFFHNLVDSDDSRKKAASADAKKKKGRDAGGTDLDLPEHGFMLRNTQTLQRDQPEIPSPRARAQTLTNQNRDNRNRWSSYDIQACNFAEGMLPPTVPETDCSTLGQRSLSEETLNASLSADPRSLSKITDSFINHSDSAARQPDVMRKHAQLLQSIQKSKANRLSQPDKTIDARADQSSNGYCLTTEMVIDGQKKDATSIKGHNTDQKLNDLQKTSSCDSADGNLRPQSQTATSSSDALALLSEKSNQINKAIGDKRRILSQLFSVTEDDLNHLLEKNVDISADLSIRKMILISLLQSDQLTSVISSLLVPLNASSTDGNVDKEAATAEGDRCFEDKASSQSQLLHEVAFRLHSHLTLLQQMVDRDAVETDRLKKDLEDVQKQIRMKSMPAEANRDLSEVSLSSDEIIVQDADLLLPSQVQGSNNKSLSNTVDDVSDSASNQETQPIENRDLSVPCKNENAEESLPLADELLTNTEHSKVAQVALADTDVKMDAKLPSDVSQNISPCIAKCIDTVNAEIYVENKVIVLNDKEIVGQLHESVPCCEIREEEISAVREVPSERNLDVALSAEVNDDNRTDLQDTNDDLEKQVDEAGEDFYLSDGSSRKFMNLESIPEDDDRLSCCDVELKVSAHKTLEQELVLEDGVEAAVQDDVLIAVEGSTTFSKEGEAQSNLEGDIRSDVDDDDVQSKFNEGLQRSTGDTAADVKFNLGDAQSYLGHDFLSIIQVHEDAPFSIADTVLHAQDDTQSGAVGDARSDTQGDTRSDMQDDARLDRQGAPRSDTQDDAKSDTQDDARSETQDDARSDMQDDTRSDTQDDTRSDTEDDSQSSSDEIEINVADGQDSCQGSDPVIIVKVDVNSDDDLQNCGELESTLAEERSPQMYDLTRSENLESKEEKLGIEIKREVLETDRDTETSTQMESESSTESENERDSESEDDGTSESDIVESVKTLFLDSVLKENIVQEAERKSPIESGNVNELILDEAKELTELEEMSHFDILLEMGKADEINDSETVTKGLLHNHVQNKSTESSDGFSQESSQREIAEVANEARDLNECDKITKVRSGSE